MSKIYKKIVFKTFEIYFNYTKEQTKDQGLVWLELPNLSSAFGLDVQTSPHKNFAILFEK